MVILSLVNKKNTVATIIPCHYVLFVVNPVIRQRLKTRMCGEDPVQKEEISNFSYVEKIQSN